MNSRPKINLDDDIALKNITTRQKQVLQVIRDFTAERGYPPTVREAGEKLGLTSSASIHAHMVALGKMGYLNREEAKPRAVGMNISPVNKSSEYYINPVTSGTVSIPLVGRVTAGLPIFAEENVEECFNFPVGLFGLRDAQDLFMLNVIGDSMKNAGIFDGDFIVVKKQQQARNGDIVVALVDEEEATVKRFFKGAKKITLMPENEAYAPIEGDNIAVLGKVVSVFRNL